MSKKVSMLLVFVLLALSMSACYNKTTEEDQALVITKNGEIQEIKFGGGRSWSATPYVEGTVVGMGTREATFITDGENGRAWTKDSQPVIITMTLQYRIIKTDANIRFLWSELKPIVESDVAKAEAVRTRFLSEVKDVTTQYTLLEIVGIPGLGGDEETSEIGRDLFVEDVFDELAPQLEATGLELVSLRLTNIDPADDEYEALLNEASKSKAREKVANDNIKVKEAQQREARIDNDILKERAENDALIREINARVWQDDRAFEIELTRLMAQALGNGDLIIFVPEGEDISYIINGATGNVIKAD
jgi:regulator of protease activity HflC (stomatin/prohibitin superfamily)